MSKQRLAAILIGLFLLPSGRADEASQTLEKLYQHAQQELQQTRAVDQQREKRFLAARDKRQAQVQEVEQMLAQERRREERLKNAFAANKTELEQLRDRLERRSASLSIFFGAVRQAAGKATAALHESLISAQYPGREEISDKLADRTVFPAVEQVERLWRIMQQEMTESGKVVRFQAPVLMSADHEKNLTVTRVGSFDVLAEGRYLAYLSDKRKLSALGDYSASSHSEQVSGLEAAVNGYRIVGIDPSGGAKLGVIMQARDFAEGIAQGHAIGLLSLGLGLAGLLVPIGGGRTRYLGSITGATLFSLGIVILMSSMFEVFFGDAAQPASYAEMEIVRPDPKQNALTAKQDELPERKPRPEILPLPQRLVLQQANLLPSVPSPMSLPKLSADLHMTGGPVLGGVGMSAARMPLDNEVIPLVQIPPIYPARAERLHIGGTVILEFTINELGRPENPTIVKSEPPKIFDQSAIQAILSWRFKPKLENGKPVASLARQRFDFTPQD